MKTAKQVHKQLWDLRAKWVDKVGLINSIQMLLADEVDLSDTILFSTEKLLPIINERFDKMLSLDSYESVKEELGLLKEQVVAWVSTGNLDKQVDAVRAYEGSTRLLKRWLANAQSEEKELAKGERDLEATLHEVEFDEKTLEYGWQSVQLTNVNIGVAIGVPVAVFLATFLMLAFPEIANWVRHLIGLAELQK